MEVCIVFDVEEWYTLVANASEIVLALVPLRLILQPDSRRLMNSINILDELAPDTVNKSILTNIFKR